MSTAIEILLVEDNPDDLELALFALKKNNFANKIHVARDGEEALDFLFCRGAHEDRSFEHPPRVVLLDLKLPKVDGLEVLRAVKADPRTKAVPVVVMTSSTQQRDMVEGYHLGVNSYIQKPIDFAEFREIIKQLGFYWLVINQPAPPDAFKPMEAVTNFQSPRSLS
ncbi:MAG: response regulator [Verrucomicrobiota bacterium]